MGNNNSNSLNALSRVDSRIDAEARDLVVKECASRGIQIRRIAGTGGSAIVVKGRVTAVSRDNKAKKYVAVKISWGGEDVVRLWHNETAAMERLGETGCSHVPVLIEAFVVSYRPDVSICIVVMPYYEAGSLHDMLNDAKRKLHHVNTILLIMRQVAKALATAHALGMCHLDVKPENIMLSRRVEGNKGLTAVLCDWANSSDEPKCHLPTSLTFRYAAPELTSPFTKETIDGLSADAWSFGMTMETTLDVLHKAKLGTCGKMKKAAQRLMESDPSSRPGLSEVCALLDQ